MPKDFGALTPKEQRFVDEYLVDLCGAQAAIRAGYAKKSAHVTASRLLRRAKVGAALAAAQQARATRTRSSADRTLLELERIAYVDPRQLVRADGGLLALQDMPSDLAAAIASVEVINRKMGEHALEQQVKVKFWNKTSALELLGRHQGLLAQTDADPIVPAAATGRPLRVIFGGRYRGALPPAKVRGVA